MFEMSMVASQDTGLSFPVVFLIAYAIVFGIIIGVEQLAIHIVKAIGLYRMAKNVGHDKPWLAWIPFANAYVMFTIPQKPLKMLAFNKIFENRKTPFWIDFVITILCTILLPVMLVIPPLMYIASPLLMISVFLCYPMYQDLYECYFEPRQAKICAVLSTIVAYAPIVIFFIAARREPKIMLNNETPSVS